MDPPNRLSNQVLESQFRKNITGAKTVLGYRRNTKVTHQTEKDDPPSGAT
jgi:hypothetical protein